MRNLFLSITAIISSLVSLNAFAGLDPEKPTVFITGANRGIGLEFVKQYTENGWNVIATARKPEKAEDLNALAAKHDTIVVEQLDVTDYARIDELAEQYKDQPFDIFLSNAGITPKYKTAFVRAAKIDYDMARKSYEVNALAPLRLSTAFMPNLSAAEDGKLVIVSSKAGSFAAKQAEFPIMYSYRASKAALNMLMYTLAFETPKAGVTLVLLSPGTVHTTQGSQRKGTILPEESVGKMIAVVDGVTPENNGQFLDYTDGSVIEW